MAYDAKHQALITLDGCMATIRELANTGSRKASYKLALWAAILSPHKKLAPNGKQTRVLAPFVESELPANEAHLRRLLTQGTGSGVFGTHLKAIYAIEALDRAGLLGGGPQDGWTVAQWNAWRDTVANGRGKLPGIGMKTATFAGLLMCPLTCPLVPVDMWVMRRMGYDYDSPKSRTEYLNIEHAVRDERDRNGHSNLPLGAWHWFKWSEMRQMVGAEPLAEQPESHAMLSPRAY